MGQKFEGNCDLWVLNKKVFKNCAENLKKIVGAGGIYLLNSTANPAQFEWKWAGLAVLFTVFSRYLTNGSHHFFSNFQEGLQSLSN